MTIRITDGMRYEATIRNLFVANTNYGEAMTRLASQKRINRISDDPLGVSQVLTLKQANADVGLYSDNIGQTNSWLAETESKLNSAMDLLVRASELAVSQASATANASSRKIASREVDVLLDGLLSLANAKLGDRYLFAGTRTDTEPFRRDYTAAAVDGPYAAPENTYQGTVTKGGTYTGTENRTFVVKIVKGGDEGEATYQVSRDGGKTWSAESAAGDLQNTVDLGDGVTLDFSAGEFGAGDIFRIEAYAAGYYRGNADELRVAVGKNASTPYGVTGAAAFTAQGGGEVEVFQVLNDLKKALEDNDAQGVADQIDKLKAAQDQVSLAVSRCGVRANRLEIARNNLKDLETSLAQRISDLEDADIAELSVKFSAKEAALQSSYLVATRLQNASILNFFD